MTDIYWLETCIEATPLADLDLTESFKQFISSSTDGSILLWDTRLKFKDPKNLSIIEEYMGKPFMKIPITASDSSFDYSLTRLCFAPAEAELSEKDKATQLAAKVKPSGRILGKFYGGSEEGDILYIDFSIDKLNDEKGTRKYKFLLIT